MPRRLTKDEIEEMRRLKKEGKSQTQLSIQFKVSVITVRYWTDEKVRQARIKRGVEFFRKLPQEEKRKRAKNGNEYRKKYNRERYHKDEEFKKRLIDSAKKWKAKRAEEVRVFQQITGERPVPPGIEEVGEEEKNGKGK